MYTGNVFYLSNTGHLVENILFNFGDIMYEMIDMETALGVSDYYRYGKNVGRITSDVFFVNPYDGEKVWNEKNSEVIEDTES